MFWYGISKDAHAVVMHIVNLTLLVNFDLLKNMKHLAVLLKENGITILTTESVKDARNVDEQIKKSHGKPCKLS